MINKTFLFAILMICMPVFAVYPETVECKTETGSIYGTLEFPDGDSPCPLVIIVAGSGPTDRNGNSSQFNLRTDCYKKISASLTSSGIAVLRYDKRGVAASISAYPPEESMTFDVYVNDFVSLMKIAKQNKRFKKIYIAGHSEGSLVGMLAISKEPCSGFISLAGAGRGIDEVILEQVKNNSANTKEVRDKAERIISSLKAGKTVNDVPLDMDALFRPSIQPYMISWMKYDPAAEIAKLTCPVLILQGTSDIQVSVKDADLLARAKPQAVYKKLAGVTHMLKKIKNESEQQLSYINPSLPVSEELLSVMISFVNEK